MCNSLVYELIHNLSPFFFCDIGSQPRCRIKDWLRWQTLLCILINTGNYASNIPFLWHFQTIAVWLWVLDRSCWHLIYLGLIIFMNNLFDCFDVLPQLSFLLFRSRLLYFYVHCIFLRINIRLCLVFSGGSGGKAWILFTPSLSHLSSLTVHIYFYFYYFSHCISTLVQVISIINMYRFETWFMQATMIIFYNMRWRHPSTLPWGTPSTLPWGSWTPTAVLPCCGSTLGFSCFFMRRLILASTRYLWLVYTFCLLNGVCV